MTKNKVSLLQELYEVIVSQDIMADGDFSFIKNYTKKLERKTKIALLMAQDIVMLKNDFFLNDYGFICSILEGDGWKQYKDINDLGIDSEFEDRVLDCNEEIFELAQKLDD